MKWLDTLLWGHLTSRTGDRSYLTQQTETKKSWREWCKLYNTKITRKYCKILIISPGLIFVQEAFLMGLFSGELIFGGAYYWKGFCVSKWVGLDNKNSLKHYENSPKQIKTACTKSLWAYIREGLLSEGFLRLRFGGLIFGRAYFWGAYYRNFTVLIIFVNPI